jgi:hypothetical protein
LIGSLADGSDVCGVRGCYHLDLFVYSIGNWCMFLCVR